jgi:hypothetical protein
MEEKSLLAEELAHFESIKSKLLASNKDQYALIKGHDLVGTFTTFEEAYKAGVEKFGNVPFLIKQVVEKELIHRIPALTFGLGRAPI